MQESIFTKIINGEIPCHKVYEDDKTIAFMPLHMMAKGHVLVVPKTQVDEFIDLPEDDYIALMHIVQKVGKRMKQVLQTERIGIQVIGLDVAHVHCHVIAFDNLEEYLAIPDPSTEPDHDALGTMAKRLAF